MNGLCRKGDAALQQEAANLVDQCGATLDKSVPHAVHGLPVDRKEDAGSSADNKYTPLSFIFRNTDEVPHLC